MIKRDELTNKQSCLNRAADDEMLFVLLARDVAAPATIRFWADERVRLCRNHRNDPKIVEALACADAMDRQRAYIK